MIRSTARRLVATAVLTGGLLAGSMAGAQAQQVVVDDAAGDVLSVEFSEQAEVFTPAPGVRNGDVLRSRFKHTKRAVSTTVSFADLRRTGEFRFDALEIVTGSGRRYGVDILAGKNRWQGVSFISPRARSAQPVRCNVEHTIDYTFNLVRVRVPRSCLGNPRFVRVGTGSVWLESFDFESETVVAYADDAQRNGAFGNNLKMSRFLRAG